MQETIADRIRAARKELKLSQPDAVRKFGIPLGSIRKYESGPSEPGSQALKGLVLGGVSANWLLTGEEPMLMEELRHQARELEALRASHAALQAQLAQAEARLAETRPPGVILNETAMRYIITGVLEGASGRGFPPAQIARRAVELYCRAVAEELITPTGVGEGGAKSA